mmetsp:Transcript_11603/g.30211  ORF Transcript_11603/g.30211 Transcript_11603/m.30211 type:complete len:203 (-) Transcript_11603:345-953(-)
MFDSVVPTSSSPDGEGASEVTCPEIWSAPMVPSTLKSPGDTIVSASPEPSTRLPAASAVMAVIWRGMRFFGPTRLKSFSRSVTSNTSPVSVPAYTFSSSSETCRHVKQRRYCPSWQSIGRTLRSCTSNVQTRMLSRPAVMIVSSDVLPHATVSARSCAAGLPQMAIPRELGTSTCHTTRLLSSSPPIEARNSPEGENARACT